MNSLNGTRIDKVLISMFYSMAKEEQPRFLTCWIILLSQRI